MVSAFIVHLAGIRGGRPSYVVRRNWYLGAGPFGEDGEEAGDILSDLASVLSAQVTLEAWLPDFACPVDQIVVCCVRWFTEDLTGGLAPFRASGLRLRHPTDNLGPQYHGNLWRPLPRDHRWFVSYSGTSGSMIENLWLLPALTISSRRPLEPVSQVIE